MMDVLKKCNKNLLLILLEACLICILMVNVFADNFSISLVILILMNAISDDFEKTDRENKWMK